MQTTTDSPAKSTSRLRSSSLFWVLLGLGVLHAIVWPPYLKVERPHFLRACAIAAGQHSAVTTADGTGYYIAKTIVDDTRIYDGFAAPGWLDGFHESHHWSERRLAEKQFVQDDYTRWAILRELPAIGVAEAGYEGGSRTIVIFYLGRLFTALSAAALLAWAHYLAAEHVRLGRGITILSLALLASGLASLHLGIAVPVAIAILACAFLASWCPPGGPHLQPGR